MADRSSWERRTSRTPSFLAVLLSVWFGATSLVIHYPASGAGRDARLRDEAFTLVLLLTSICWARANRHRRVYLVVFAVLAALLVVQSFAFGYGPTGALAADWWNQKVTGVLMLACAVAGWSRAHAVERSLALVRV